MKLRKNKESFSPYFEAEDSVITKKQTKEGNINKQHGLYGINRCRIAKFKLVSLSKTP